MTCMNRSRCVLIAVLIAATMGCRGGSPSAGTFAAEVKFLWLVPGQKQDVVLTVGYTLPANLVAATTVSYKARLAAPQGWSAEPGEWEHSQAMKTTDIGFRETRKVALTVPGDAVPGEHVVKLTITPTAGQAQTLDLKFQVAAK